MFIVLMNGVHGSSAEAVGMSNAEQPIKQCCRLKRILYSIAFYKAQRAIVSGF